MKLTLTPELAQRWGIDGEGWHISALSVAVSGEELSCSAQMESKENSKSLLLLAKPIASFGMSQEVSSPAVAVVDTCPICQTVRCDEKCRCT